MPELPEVATMVGGLNQYTKGLIIKSVKSDWPKIVRRPDWTTFQKTLANKKIIASKRRGKNILVTLSDNFTLRLHMKMTGHLLWENYKKDPQNRFIHMEIAFSNGRHLYLSDMRKFARVELYDTSNPPQDLLKLGPEPLAKNFTFNKFKNCLDKKKQGKIKQVLMNQEVIAGIGNIYSDEILWRACVHPKQLIKDLDETELKSIYSNLKNILKKGIRLRGDSASDYRDIHGQKGSFQDCHMVYRKTGQNCPLKNCAGKIERTKVAQRSAHYCNQHQKITV